mmetsp:Transcript_6231/g.10741  ORF Transcript_6231/g.10741 Transcript_6231/m.10741 type:complete len:131 (+) Transcript_6231:48-440(+)|eukprot:CAMPEP_0178819246 /NCGR_PEP_ID=MMETSP0746-20121128/2868_1 /TAXON_ID=913974 /ORGANISM="Nitzschia punctata, Strain CCMP561" /LENGTH=130 /DNA_ID=CAMNT_0020480495 /DNA_START=29 /DNA_END=421 /DNA_ORIENTATION=-
MTERTWSCMCGNFEGKVTGDPNLACWCHCITCRKATGAAMQLAAWDKDKFEILKGKDDLISYAKDPDSGSIRHSCAKCGSFCYKNLGEARVAPLGALSGDRIKPTCHIFVGEKGHQEVMFPELAQHEGWP